MDHVGSLIIIVIMPRYVESARRAACRLRFRVIDYSAVIYPQRNCHRPRMRERTGALARSRRSVSLSLSLFFSFFILFFFLIPFVRYVTGFGAILHKADV